MNESKLGFSQLRVQLQIRELLPKPDQYSTRIASGSLQGISTNARAWLACSSRNDARRASWILLACLRAGGHNSLFGQHEAGKGAGTELNNFVSPYPNLPIRTRQNYIEITGSTPRDLRVGRRNSRAGVPCSQIGTAACPPASALMMIFSRIIAAQIESANFAHVGALH